MKILVLAYKFPLQANGAIVSGEVKNPYNFCVELARKGHEVTIYSIDAIKAPVEAYLDGMHVMAEPDISLKGVVRYLYRAYKTKSWLSKHGKNFDIVHSHASFFGLGFLFSGLSKKVAFVSTPHGTNIPEIGTELKKSFKDLLRRLNAYLQMRLDSYVYKRSDCCVSVSQFQTREMQLIYDIPLSKITVIYNGVSPQYRVVEVTSPKYDFLFVGRAAKKKGLDVILELAKFFPQKNFKAVIGTKRFQTVDSSFIKLFEEQENIDVEWAVCEKRMPEIYRSAKVLVVPSRGYESLPTVILESIACGTPVVATCAWGNPEVIRDSRLMFDEDNFDSLIASIKNAGSIDKSHILNVYEPKLVEVEVDKLLDVFSRIKK